MKIILITIYINIQQLTIIIMSYFFYFINCLILFLLSFKNIDI